MVHARRGLLILTVLAGILWPKDGLSRSTPADSTEETLPTPPRTLELPPANAPSVPSTLPSVAPLPGFAPGEDGPAPGSGVFGPPGETVGWFAGIEVGLINPHVDSHLNSGSNIKAPFLTASTPTGSVQTPLPPGSNADVISAFGRPITLPMAPLDWTGSPRLRLGYRFDQGAGNVQLEWRMVASQGTDSIANFDTAGDGFLKSRLNVQQVRFTYGTSEFVPDDPTIDRVWGVRFGLSAANVFFDSQARGRQVLEERASNSFGGVGPTFAFQFHKPLAKTRFSLYGELDGTGLIGFTRQHFRETAIVDGQTFSDSEALRRQSNGVGIFGVEGGFSYAPWDDHLWRFTLGYQWQRWWWVGATSDSNAALTLQGLFFRGEWRY